MAFQSGAPRPRTGAGQARAQRQRDHRSGAETG